MNSDFSSPALQENTQFLQDAVSLQVALVMPGARGRHSLTQVVVKY